MFWATRSVASPGTKSRVVVYKGSDAGGLEADHRNPTFCVAGECLNILLC